MSDPHIEGQEGQDSGMELIQSSGAPEWFAVSNRCEEITRGILECIPQ